jgi:PPOX class probable F420-dependent enzyme
VDEDDARRRFALARVARLATVTPQGRPHVVPVTFAVDGPRVWTGVDDKPKRARNLQRLANLAANPHVSLLVDHYEDEWERLWWVRADGTATVHRTAPAGLEALAALAAKYEQYRAQPPQGPFVEVLVVRWRWWSAA